MNRTMNISIRMVVVLMVVAFLAQPVAAATISYLGLDSDPNGAWRSTDVPKPAAGDPNGDDAYGNDGYYVFHDTVGGVRTPPNTVYMSSLPAYIASVAQTANVEMQYSNSTGMAPVDDPSQAISGTVANLPMTGFAFKSVISTAYWDFFDVTLAQSGKFTLSVLTGVQNANQLNGAANTRVTKATNNLVVAESGAISGHDGSPDYTFFEVWGNAGDVFKVGTRVLVDPEFHVPSIAGIAFEGFTAGEAPQDVPEPSTIVMLVSGLVGLLAYAWRKRK